MTRPRPNPGLRAAALAFAGLAALAVPARPARAMGCHVSDRPALGSYGPRLDAPAGSEVAAGAPSVAAPVQVQPRPCSGEVPGSVDRPLLAADRRSAAAFRPPDAAPSRAPAETTPTRPDPLASRWERPPRRPAARL